jgi:hypothetical protein
LSIGTGHHGIPINEEAHKLVKEDTNGFLSDQTVDIPFVVGKEVIRSHSGAPVST